MSQAQKVPFVRSLQLWGEQLATRTLARLGLSLPGTVVSVSGAIVTVNLQVHGVTLPNVTIPLGWPEYIRLPIQAGDKGFAVPASVPLGAYSGLGSGTLAAASVNGEANLSALVWLPIANKSWTAVNPNLVTVYGPDGALIRDTANTASVAIGQGAVTITAGGHTVVIDSSGVKIDDVVFATHMHSGVSTGGSDTGPVVP